MAAVRMVVVFTALIASVAAVSDFVSPLTEGENTFYDIRAGSYKISMSVQLPGKPFVNCRIAVTDEAVVSAFRAGSTEEIDSLDPIRLRLLSVEHLFVAMQSSTYYSNTTFNTAYGYPEMAVSKDRVALKLQDFVLIAKDVVRERLFKQWEESLGFWSGWNQSTYNYVFTPPKFYASDETGLNRIVNVQNGVVVSVLNAETNYVVRLRGEKTVNEWFFIIKSAINRAAKRRMQFKYDPLHGYPTLIFYAPSGTIYLNDIPSYSLSQLKSGLRPSSAPLSPAVVALVVIAGFVVIVACVVVILYLLDFPPRKVWAWYLSTPLSCCCCCISRSGKNRYNPRFVANSRLPGNDDGDDDDYDDLNQPRPMNTAQGNCADDGPDAGVEMNEAHDAVRHQYRDTSGASRTAGKDVDMDGLAGLPPHMRRHTKYVPAAPAVAAEDGSNGEDGAVFTAAPAVPPFSDSPGESLSMSPEPLGSPAAGSATAEQRPGLPPMPQLPPIRIPT